MIGITLEDISKIYGKKIALINVDLSLEKPGVYSVLGPNGSGKSTMLKIIAGLVNQSGGSVKRFYNGKRIFIQEFLMYSGVVLGSPIFRPSLTGRDLLELASKMKNIKDVQKEIERVAGLMLINEFIGEEMRNYSSGMLQRTLLASALVGDPEILILDEPTSGLDPKSRIIVQELIQSISESQNKVVIFSTHDVWEADLLSNYYVFIENGRLVSNLVENSKKDHIFCILTNSNKYQDDTGDKYETPLLQYHVVGQEDWTNFEKDHDGEILEYHKCSKFMAEYAAQLEQKKANPLQ